MSNTCVAIDPNGDTLVILATKQDPPPSKEPTEPAGTTESPTFIEKHFLCSQKHLTLASRRASKLFSSAFKEASKQDDGLYHWNFGDVFDVQAFEVVLKIIHGKTRGVPQYAGLDLLSKVASIVDDLECYDALSFCTERWLSSYSTLYTLPERMDKTLAQLILVSFVFANKHIFRKCIQRAARYTCEGMPTFDLPIRADIPRRIEESRTEVLQYLVDGLYKVHDDLLQRKLGCSEGCRALLLGSLLQVMAAACLYPRPESPFYSLRLDSIISSLRDMQPSMYYSSVTGSLAGKHSGTWLLHQQPASPPASQSNTGTTQSTSSLFGGSGFSGLTTSTTAQNTSDTRSASGGDFGTPRVDSRGFGTSTTPRTTGGLFGRSTAPQPAFAAAAPSGGLFGTRTVPQTSDPFSSAPAKNEEAPKKLVQHSCSLKSFIDPLLLVAESKIQELKLDDFPQP